MIANRDQPDGNDDDDIDVIVVAGMKVKLWEQY